MLGDSKSAKKAAEDAAINRALADALSKIDGVHVIAYQPARPGEAPSPDEIRRLRVRGTRDECSAAGMKPWDESGLYLVPGAWVDALPDDLLVLSIRGEASTVGVLRQTRPGWNDTRFDLLSFGWVPRDGERDAD